MNDDLVAKKFAYYNQGSGECSRSKELDRIAVTFFSSVLTQTVPDSNQTAVETPPSPGKNTVVFILLVEKFYLTI